MPWPQILSYTNKKVSMNLSAVWLLCYLNTKWSENVYYIDLNFIKQNISVIFLTCHTHDSKGSLKLFSYTK